MDEKIIIAGFGGQGVLSLGQFIAYAAIADGKEVTWLPSYGPEMRGGTSNCSVVISDRPVASPIISAPDCLIAMNKPSLYKFQDRVRSGGTIIVNKTLIPDIIERKDVKVIYIDAGDLSLKAGNPKTANIVVLGAYVKQSGLFSKELVSEMITKKFISKPKLIPANLSALDLGYNFA
ncbi:MAG: 2-oxoacid:acceptor oxidoreductase family protein [Christensenellaceae bacterium]|jgi:2-oxoglutarate ferredoxin oxidoreductase subunit gamma|nr:2-oxoacid:acceptor oxidoreductase family protein [Christensenellaceae bacterium]